MPSLQRLALLAALCAPSVAAANAPSLAASFSQPSWRYAAATHALLQVEDEPAPPVIVTPTESRPVVDVVPVAPVAPARSAALADVSFERSRYDRARRLHITSNIISGVSAALIIPAAGVLLAGTLGGSDTLLVTGVGLAAASSIGFIGGSIGSNIGAINATSAVRRAQGDAVPFTAGVVGLSSIGAGILLAPFGGTLIGPIVGLICGAVQFGQARTGGGSIGFTVDRVVPTRDGLAIIGRF